jgi:hypothetical protein
LGSVMPPRLHEHRCRAAAERVMHGAGAANVPFAL